MCVAGQASDPSCLLRTHVRAMHECHSVLLPFSIGIEDTMNLLLASLLCAATASALTADPVAPANFYLDFATDIDGVGKVRTQL